MSELASPPSGAAAPQPAPTQIMPSARSREAGSRSADTATAFTPVDPFRDAPEDGTTPATQPSGTIAGMLLSGRYRLRTRVGSDTVAGAEFWRAEDTMLRRDVAITVLRRLAEDGSAAQPDDAGEPDGDALGATRAGEMMVRALRSGSFEHPGCARLLDVLAPGTGGMPADVLGAAVTEWVPGRSLAEVVAEGLSKPTAVARGVAPLAAAAEAAHRRGLVLGIDHPQRLRVSPEGKVQVCFALPRPTITPADDVRGLGAVLYALLTAHWPLSGVDAARAGLAAAERDGSGEVVPPSRERPGVPVELDTLTRGALGDPAAPGHVHTAAAVNRLLTEVIVEDDRLALFPPVHDGVPSAPGDVWQDDGGEPPSADPGRRRKLTVGVSVLAAAVLAVLVFLTFQMGSLFSDGSDTPAIVVGSAPDEPAAGGDDPAPPAGPGGVGDVAAVAGVEVYAEGDADRDNSGRVSQVIDGDTDSGWKTSTYRQQFPAYKTGIGVMVSFASGVQLAELTIESPSPGTVIEVRSAPGADAALAETTTIGEATLVDGATTIALDGGDEPVTHVLVWISKLGGAGSDFSSQINELELRRAAG